MTQVTEALTALAYAEGVVSARWTKAVRSVAEATEWGLEMGQAVRHLLPYSDQREVALDIPLAVAMGSLQGTRVRPEEPPGTDAEREALSRERHDAIDLETTILRVISAAVAPVEELRPRADAANLAGLMATGLLPHAGEARTALSEGLRQAMGGLARLRPAWWAPREQRPAGLEQVRLAREPQPGPARQQTGDPDPVKAGIKLADWAGPITPAEIRQAAAQTLRAGAIENAVAAVERATQQVVAALTGGWPQTRLDVLAAADEARDCCRTRVTAGQP